MNKKTLPTRGAETLRVEPFSGNALYYHIKIKILIRK